MCLMVADLLEFMPVSRDLRLAAGTGHRLRLAFSQSLGLYLGVYMHAPKRGQVRSDGASSLLTRLSRAARKITSFLLGFWSVRQEVGKSLMSGPLERAILSE